MSIGLRTEGESSVVRKVDGCLSSRALEAKEKAREALRPQRGDEDVAKAPPI